MKLEKAIEAVQNATAELERLAKLKSIDQPRGETAAHLHAQKTLKNAVSAAKDALTSGARHSYKMKFDTLKSINKLSRTYFKHSSTGGVRPQREIFTYSQLTVVPNKGDQRLHEIFPGERRNDLSSVRILRPQLTAVVNAGVVGEGQPKPVRQWTLTQTIINAEKIAVTDVVTEEFILAAPSEELLDFLILAHTQNVLDVFDSIIHSNLIAATTTNFSSTTYAGTLNPNPSTGIQSGIRWHDFLAAIALYFKYNLADNIADIEFPDTWVLPYNNPRDVYYGVMQDREPDAAYLHKGHDVERWYNSLTPEALWPGISSWIIAFDKNAFRLDIYDDVIVTFERIVDQNEERNLFRITAEIYFWFYSLYEPAKSVRASVNDITNLS